MEQRQYFKSEGKHQPHVQNGVSMSIPKRLRKSKPTHGITAKSGRARMKRSGMDRGAKTLV